MQTFQSTIQRHFIFGIICAQVIHCIGANDDLNAKPGPQQLDQPRTRQPPDDADANIKELEDVVNLNKNDYILHGGHSSPGAMNNGWKKNNHRRTQSAAEIAAAKANNVELLEKIQSTLRPLGVTIDSSLFLTQLYEPSKIYKFMDLDAALEVAAIDGIADNILYLGDVSNSLGHEYGLVNLAAFLAQCMKETIQYDACDENNWDLFNGVYPLSNACGQLEQSYQNYKCPPEEQHMECPVDPNMEITATTHANWYGAPPGLFCAPKSKLPITGIWDHEYWCDCPWNGESCDVYEGQKSGRFDNEVAVANRAGRTDVEGCCWWGRGVIQTTGVCNYGKLNYYLGKAAADEGRDSRYPDIDFCKTPEIICASEEHAELKWIAGLFYWMKDVQSYNQDGWHYLTELYKFVNGGMTDMGFIDAVSGIVNRGCHNPPCATGEVDGLLDRRGNFQKVLTTFGLPSVPVGSTRPPSTLPPVPGTSPASGAVILADSSPWLIYFIDTLQSKREELEYKALSYQQDGVLKLSDHYTFDALVASLTTAYQTGYGGNIFYLGKESDLTPVDHSMQKVGLTNIAAFLSQSITEHIQDDPCSDNNLVAIEGIYMVTSGCEKLEEIYPAVDFCSGPESVCSQLDTYRTLMWDIAFFEWIENVQSYDRDGWNYIEKLNQFVEDGLKDFSFISTVSKIVAKGSADYVGEVPNSNQRWGKFRISVPFVSSSFRLVAVYMPVFAGLYL
mmetsp:Transcript_12134/g.23659  ORF Transcript_12134/g.23659 Transcript_12134/m.23659 type:complete len:730 (+) Transcript_12134:73-2262(+)